MAAINQVVFDGLEGYELATENWRMIVVTSCGPRIALLAPVGGDNLLYWSKDGVARGEWRLRGGHRVWLTRPMADESEDTYLPDNQPCKVELLENGLIATAPAQNYNRLERGMRVQCLGDGVFQVTSFIKNTGDLIYSGGIWSPTCVNPTGGTMRIPLGTDDASWDVVKIIMPRVFAGNTTTLEDAQAHFEGNDLVVTPIGRVLKRCAAAPKGIVSIRWNATGVTFTKKTRYDPFARYPLDGCNLAVFVGQDNWMAELETFGAEQPIIPEKTIEHSEVWELKA